ncbi:MAG TPA: anthranilate phosphoribosyltransferase [Acidimicrobiales bacterium]|nr:anthranilate phosphoribosyltransferase [Acidimicrobiales bacterium]
MSAVLEALRAATSRRDLTRDEMTAAMEQIAAGDADQIQVGALLTALRTKGETAEEVSAAAGVMRRHAKKVDVEGLDVVDTCGTGGDGAGTFNISTAAAIVAAAAGAPVAKHGNRSVSSRCGSVDVLEELGVVVGDIGVFLSCLKEVGLGFLLAPNHHAAFRAVGATRAALGVPTIFNLVGPLANPASAQRQVVGVSTVGHVPVVAEALRSLGTEHALVVHGDGTDEIAVSGTTFVHEVRRGSVSAFRLTPDEIGVGRWRREDLQGGDASRNAAICTEVLSGEKGGPRDAVLANAGAALYVAGRAQSIREGVDLAARAIDDGRARRTLAGVVELSRAS